MIEKYLNANWRDNSRNVMIYKHSMLVASAAKVIARRCGMDSEKAKIYGEMHDIGKFNLEEHELYKHPLIGYNIMLNDYPDIAMICLTHSFLTIDYDRIISFCRNDKEEADNIFNILKNVKYNDYIKLIQLCDKISSFDSYVTIGKKLQWYQEKQKISVGALDKRFAKLYTIKAKFDRMAGLDIYSLLKLTVNTKKCTA